MKKEKRKMMFTLLILLFLGLGIGYAALASNLSINGTSTLIASSWDIHFENLNVTDGSVDIGTGDSAATITSPTTITYTVTLAQPGDFYDFTVDVKNDGTIDGMIGNISYKVNGSSTEHFDLPFEYYIMYTDGIELDTNQQLLAGEKESLKVHIGYAEDIEPTDLPSSDTTETITVEITYVQADENAKRIIRPDSFATDDWETIIYAVKKVDNPYQVGDEKEIEIDGHTYHLRIINNSNPVECTNLEFSQSSCGFVLEFKELIYGDHRVMNSNNTNAGGWPATDLRTYLNTTFYNKIPSPLKEAIDDTYVVSSNSCFQQQTTCGVFTSTDKIYILSMCELQACNSSYYQDYNRVRIMDYYALHPENSYREKRLEGSLTTSGDYWIRTGAPTNVGFFELQDGSATPVTAYSNSNYSPVFRLYQSLE